MKTALIIVDLQNDFLPGGALGVPNGDKIIKPIIDQMFVGYELVICTQDFHPDNHCSFSDTPLFEDKSWPKHCVQGTNGAKLAQELEQHIQYVDYIVQKGTNPDFEAYSGFGGKTVDGRYLNALLVDRHIGAVDIVGLALDYCVKATAIDARHHGFRTNVILDATAPVSYKTGLQAVAEMAQEGVNFV